MSSEVTTSNQQEFALPVAPAGLAINDVDDDAPSQMTEITQPFNPRQNSHEFAQTQKAKTFGNSFGSVADVTTTQMQGTKKLGTRSQNICMETFNASTTQKNSSINARFSPSKKSNSVSRQNILRQQYGSSNRVSGPGSIAGGLPPNGKGKRTSYRKTTPVSTLVNMKIDVSEKSQREMRADPSATQNLTAVGAEDVADLITNTSQLEQVAHEQREPSNELQTSVPRRSNESCQDFAQKRTDDQVLAAAVSQPKRPQTRGAGNKPQMIQGNRTKFDSQVLSQAFALSHDSYSTVRSNYRRDADFFNKRRGMRVERLINQINNQPQRADSPTRIALKYGSVQQFQNMSQIKSQYMAPVQHPTTLGSKASAPYQTEQQRRPGTTQGTASRSCYPRKNRNHGTLSHVQMPSDGRQSRGLSKLNRVSPKGQQHFTKNSRSPEVQKQITYLRNAKSAASQSFSGTTTVTKMRNNRRRRQQMLHANQQQFKTIQAESSSQPHVGGANVPTDTLISLQTMQNLQAPINLSIQNNSLVYTSNDMSTLQTPNGGANPMHTRYRRRIPKSTRHSCFANANEAVSFFRADVQPLRQGDRNKKSFLTIEKKTVHTELKNVQKNKLAVLHKSLQMLFQIHFLADKRRKKNFDYQHQAFTPKQREDQFRFGEVETGPISPQTNDDYPSPMTPQLNLTSPDQKEKRSGDALEAANNNMQTTDQKSSIGLAASTTLILEQEGDSALKDGFTAPQFYQAGVSPAKTEANLMPSKQGSTVGDDNTQATRQTIVLKKAIGNIGEDASLAQQQSKDLAQTEGVDENANAGSHQREENPASSNNGDISEAASVMRLQATDLEGREDAASRGIFENHTLDSSSVENDEGDNDDDEPFFSQSVQGLRSEIQLYRQKQQLLRDELQEKAQDVFNLQSASTSTEHYTVKNRISLALKLISKMKNHQINQQNCDQGISEGQKDAISHLNEVTKYEVRSLAFTSPQNALSSWTQSQPMQHAQGSHFNGSPERKFKVDDKASKMVSKVMYDQMDSPDKIDYLKVHIQNHESSLRERTDATLQSQKAFDLILDNQRFFAQCQDKFSNLAKKAREEIALRSVREVNDLICTRKNLQIEAFRLTENFKIKVNSMAQKEVEDIFAKTMKKNQFKASSTLRLARTFLNKHKAITTWRAKEHMNALAEVADEQEQDFAPARNQQQFQTRPPKLTHLNNLASLSPDLNEGDGEDDEALTQESHRQRKIMEEPESSSIGAEIPQNEEAQNPPLP